MVNTACDQHKIIQGRFRCTSWGILNISIEQLNSAKRNIIKDNLSVLKRLGRISNVYDSKIKKNGIKIVVRGETITLYFDQNLDLYSQRQKIHKKVIDFDQKVSKIANKLKNKSFQKNAPKQIVEKEKKALIDCKIEFKKLNSILNSIKN